MSTGLYSHTTRAIGTTLTANIYNADHVNHITNLNPSMTGAFSDTVAQMQSTADPYPGGVESLAGSLAGELERIRYVLAQIGGQTYWYIDPFVIPAHQVSFFNLASCPTGWTEYTALRGKYVVGLPNGGTLAGGAGIALTDQENRPIGQHTHTDYGTNTAGDNGVPAAGQGAGTVLITSDASGTVAGTNAPYHQLIACEKS